jgi:hypothetical protein
LRFREGVFRIHHVSSCALSIWQDTGEISNDSNVVIHPTIHITGLGYESQFPIHIKKKCIFKGITSSTHNSYNAIQLDAIQGLIIFTAYWISIYEVEDKRTIASTKH